MYRLPVFKEDDTEVSIPRLWNPGPSSDPAIRLHMLGDRVGYRLLDPLQPDALAVVALSYMQKVPCEFHIFTDVSMH